MLIQLLTISLACVAFTVGYPLAIGGGISCGEGWQLFCASTDTDDCHCYRLFQQQKLWDDARYHCVQQKGHLASVHSAAENDFLRRLKKKADAPEAWLGYRRVYGLRAAFEWSDGTASTFERWSEGEPNNDKESEDCVSQWGTSGGGDEWNDHHCHSTRLPFFCKRSYTIIPLAVHTKLVPNKLLLNGQVGLASSVPDQLELTEQLAEAESEEEPQAEEEKTLPENSEELTEMSLQDLFDRLNSHVGEF